MSSNNPLETSLELDSHADTTVLGAGAFITQSYNQPVEVAGYDPQQDLQAFVTVSGILAFDHPRDRQVYHLVFHQAIHMPHLNHHLLCPMQCCINDMTVNDVLKFLTCFPTDKMHAIIVCVNSATNALGLSHDSLSRHMAGLPAHLGAAVNKVKELPYNSPPKQITIPAKDRLHLCPLHPPGVRAPRCQVTKAAPTKTCNA
jgi:hypothetical protein